MSPADALKQRKARNREQLDGYVDALDDRHPGYADNLVRQRNNLDMAEMLDELAIASVTMGIDAVTRKLDEDFAEMLAMLAEDRADSRRMNEHKPHSNNCERQKILRRELHENIWQQRSSWHS